MSRTLLAAMAAAFFVVLVATSHALWLSPLLREQGDLAANALQIARASEGRELLGPYSRHGFHHPGPASFYGLAALEPAFFMFPSTMARYLAAQLALNLAAFAAAMWLLNRAGLSPSGAVAGLFLAAAPLIFLGGGNMFMLASFWGPLVVVAPMALYVAAMVRLADGDLAAAPLAAAGATMAWHTHVLTLAPLAVVGLVTGAWILRLRPRFTPGPRSRRGALLGGSAILLATAGLVPVLVEQATGKPGNLTLMWEFMRGHESQVHPWPEVIRQLGQAFTDPLVVLFPSGAAALAGVPATLAVVAVLFLVSVVQFRRAPPPWRLLTAFVWVAIATAAVSARHVYGELHTYLYYYLYGMVGLLYVAVARALPARWPAWLAGHGRWEGIGAGLVGLAVLTPWLLAHRVAPPTGQDDVATVLAGFELAQAPAVHLSLGDGARDLELWHLVPTFALALRRAGTSVTVDERFVVVCGEETRARTDGPRPPALLFTREPPAAGRPHIEVADWGVSLVRDGDRY
jgi:hypothetical protein